ncbi:MAG TPA: addiction module protein [Bryobacteraceae bacterium]|jgi:putative addiction module component (TIGR02574 family)
MNDIRDQIERLSAAEKIDLLDILWQSLEADLPPLTAAQREELDNRWARHAQDPSAVIPWDQVRTGLFKKQ